MTSAQPPKTSVGANKQLRLLLVALLDQDFSVDKPSQKWAGDSSYLWESEGWYICLQ